MGKVEMAKVHLTIGGLSLLVANRKAKSGEIAMINPSRRHMLPSDRAHWANHLPLLVVPTANIGSIDGFAPPFPLQHSIEPSWLDDASSLDEYTGFAVQGSEIRLQDSIRAVPVEGGKAPELELIANDIALKNGCRDEDSTWDSLQWIVNANEVFRQLRLADEWRASPHIGSRFILGPGRLSAEPPVVSNSGLLKIDFHGGLPPRAFSDAFRFETLMNAPELIVDMEPRRWRINLKAHGKKPIRMWLLSLDDELLPRAQGPTEHFVLYSLLPWRFVTPAVRGVCPPGDETRGGCTNLMYFSDAVPRVDESGKLIDYDNRRGV
jgi:hypothetical protein